MYPFKFVKCYWGRGVSTWGLRKSHMLLKSFLEGQLSSHAIGTTRYRYAQTVTIVSLLPLANHKTDCKMQPDFRRVTCEHVLKLMEQEMCTSVCVCVHVNSAWQILSPLYVLAIITLLL